MTGALKARIASGLAVPVPAPVRNFAEKLGRSAGARAVLFYGSNLRTGSLEGVLDFYVLLPGPLERGVWPHVSYREWQHEGGILRAKIATMNLATFRAAATGRLLDTTIWARFVQPSALAWSADGQAGPEVTEALALAAATAGRFAAALGPECGAPSDYWRALFQATYRAEFRVEKPGRENAILAVNADHLRGLLPLALDQAGVAFTSDPDCIAPRLERQERARILRWWRLRRRFGKVYNLVRLVKASVTFDGAARYAAWKIERHTGVALEVTSWREKHPLLAAPGALLEIWRSRRRS